MGFGKHMFEDFLINYWRGTKIIARIHEENEGSQQFFIKMNFEKQGSVYSYKMI